MASHFQPPARGRPIPPLQGLDQSLQFLADPYRYISRECQRHGSDVVRGRMLMRPMLFLSGARAAELFYDKERFTRVGAAPEPVRATLFGKGGVQGLDGVAHLRRKQFFLSVGAAPSTQALLGEAEAAWHAQARPWQGQRLVLYTAAQEWLMQAVCAWAGVPLPRPELRTRTAQIAALFDGAAASPTAHLHAQRARRDAEHWIGELLHNLRAGRGSSPPGSPAEAAAALTDRSGAPLPVAVAAVELLNVLRPVVAVSVFVVLAAHALHLHRDWRDKLAGGHEDDLEAFVQEVRRFYPFFPAIAARVRRDFVWEGMRFPQGTRCLLDLYGTNHDARSWSEPHQFRPERFLRGAPGPFAFIAQGGASAESHHRCPGEGITTGLMKLALRLLMASRYAVPPQDLTIDMGRMPALPRDRFVLKLDSASCESSASTPACKPRASG